MHVKIQETLSISWDEKEQGCIYYKARCFIWYSKWITCELLNYLRQFSCNDQNISSPHWKRSNMRLNISDDEWMKHYNSNSKLRGKDFLKLGVNYLLDPPQINMVTLFPSHHHYMAFNILLFIRSLNLFNHDIYLILLSELRFHLVHWRLRKVYIWALSWSSRKRVNKITRRF